MEIIEFFGNLFKHQEEDFEIKQGSTLIYIFKEELQAILTEAKKYPSKETGGDLFGSYTHGNMPIIWLSTGPGPKAKHFSAEFEQDAGYRTEWQNLLSKNYGIQYIGSWHSHHQLQLSRPSGGDMRAAENYLRRHKRNFTIEIIANHENGKTILRPYYYSTFTSQWNLVEFRVLETENPLRNYISFFDSGYKNRSGKSESLYSAPAQIKNNKTKQPKNSASIPPQNNHYEDNIDDIEKTINNNLTEIDYEEEKQASKIDDETHFLGNIANIDQLPEAIVNQLVELNEEDIPEIQIRDKMIMVIIKLDYRNSLVFATDIRNSKVNFHQISIISQNKSQTDIQTLNQTLISHKLIKKSQDGYNGNISDVLSFIRNSMQRSRG